jgi:multisubunit Na+/H+ antiporter MnhG subunit
MDSFHEDDYPVNSSDSSEFFSPISISFFQPKHAVPTPERLPPLHDTSWIGARLSPIRSFDNDESIVSSPENSVERRNVKTALRYQEPVYSSAVGGGGEYSHENTRLLRPTTTTAGPGVTFHPRYTESHASSKSPSFGILSIPEGTGLVICLLSAFQLAVMIIYSLWVSSSSWGDDESTTTFRSIILVLGTWLWRPDRAILLKWGALYSSALKNKEYWRLGGSIVMSTTAGEWLMVWITWTLVGKFQKSSRLTKLSARQLWVVYLSSALTGQLWMLAWEDELYDNSSTTCAGVLSWGTCGVLCAAGLAQPHRRFFYFMLAILLTVGAFLQRPYNSIWGILGGAYFGWALGASGLIAPERIRPVDLTNAQRLHQWRSATAAIFMWVLPVLWIAFS